MMEPYKPTAKDRFTTILGMVSMLIGMPCYAAWMTFRRIVLKKD